MTGVKALQIVDWIGLTHSKYYRWRKHYGRANEHNARIPRDHWIEDWERQAILDFHDRNPGEGYRRLTFMMLDEDVAAVSPSTTYRVLKGAGRLQSWNRKPSKKGTGFHQPTQPHQHWHIDVAHINVAGTFFYLCSILDGYSRAIVHHEIRSEMTEADVETIVQRAVEKHLLDEQTGSKIALPEIAKPRIISDNGPQFIARDFKEFIRNVGLSHVRTSPFYPQSNGKIERWHKTLKSESIRPGSPLNIDDAKRLITSFVDHYNQNRLHAGIDYVTPGDKLAGRANEILKARDTKLEKAREQRKIKRQQARQTERKAKEEKCA